MVNELDFKGRKDLARSIGAAEEDVTLFREKIVRNYGNIDLHLVLGADGEELDFVVHGAFFERLKAEAYAEARGDSIGNGTVYHVETGSVRTLERADKINFRNVDGTERGDFRETDREDVYRTLRRSLLEEFS